MRTCWSFSQGLRSILLAHYPMFRLPCCLLFFSFFVSSVLFSQERAYRKIITQEVQFLAERADPAVADKRAQIAQFSDSVAPHLEFRHLTIPIVFHIFPSPSGQPLVSEEDVHFQLAALNRDFGIAEVASDTIFPVEAAFTELRAGLDISFCTPGPELFPLPLSGIHVVETEQYFWPADHSVQTAELGGISPWKPAQLINVWVVDLEGESSGFAQMPGGSPATDGIVIDYQFFGHGDHVHPSYSEGKTLTHLMGNYLNLHDLWGASVGCSDDKVGDTPIHNGPNYGCPLYKHVSTCQGYQLEMTHNFMDNTDDICMNMFTLGQKKRVHALFQEGGARETLIRDGASSCLPYLQVDDEATSPLVKEDEYDFQVFPNPANTVFTLRLIRMQNISLDIKVYSSVGALMYEAESASLTENGEYRISCEKWPAGMYVLHLSFNGSMRSTQLIIQ